MTQDDASKDAILTRQLLREELDASNSYEGKAGASTDPDAKALYNDISREEKVHAGELSQLLSEQDPDGAKAQQEGMREAESITGKLDSFGKSNAQKAEWLGLSTDDFETSLKKAMMQKSGFAKEAHWSDDDPDLTEEEKNLLNPSRIYRPKNVAPREIPVGEGNVSRMDDSLYKRHPEDLYADMNANGTFDTAIAQRNSDRRIRNGLDQNNKAWSDAQYEDAGNSIEYSDHPIYEIKNGKTRQITPGIGADYGTRESDEADERLPINDVDTNPKYLNAQQLKSMRADIDGMIRADPKKARAPEKDWEGTLANSKLNGVEYNGPGSQQSVDSASTASQPRPRTGIQMSPQKKVDWSSFDPAYKSADRLADAFEGFIKSPYKTSGSQAERDKHRQRKKAPSDRDLSKYRIAKELGEFLRQNANKTYMPGNTGDPSPVRATLAGTDYEIFFRKPESGLDSNREHYKLPGGMEAWLRQYRDPSKQGITAATYTKEDDEGNTEEVPKRWVKNSGYTPFGTETTLRALGITSPEVKRMYRTDQNYKIPKKTAATGGFGKELKPAKGHGKGFQEAEDAKPNDDYLGGGIKRSDSVDRLATGFEAIIKRSGKSVDKETRRAIGLAAENPYVPRWGRKQTKKEFEEAQKKVPELTKEGIKQVESYLMSSMDTAEKERALKQAYEDDIRQSTGLSVEDARKLYAVMSELEASNSLIPEEVEIATGMDPEAAMSTFKTLHKLATSPEHSKLLSRPKRDTPDLDELDQDAYDELDAQTAARLSAELGRDISPEEATRLRQSGDEQTREFNKEIIANDPNLKTQFDRIQRNYEYKIAQQKAKEDHDFREKNRDTFYSAENDALIEGEDAKAAGNDDWEEEKLKEYTFDGDNVIHYKDVPDYTRFFGLGVDPESPMVVSDEKLRNILGDDSIESYSRDPEQTQKFVDLMNNLIKYTGSPVTRQVTHRMNKELGRPEQIAPSSMPEYKEIVLENSDKRPFIDPKTGKVSGGAHTNIGLLRDEFFKRLNPGLFERNRARSDTIGAADRIEAERAGKNGKQSVNTVPRSERTDDAPIERNRPDEISLNEDSKKILDAREKRVGWKAADKKTAADYSEFKNGLPSFEDMLNDSITKAHESGDYRMTTPNGAMRGPYVDLYINDPISREPQTPKMKDDGHHVKTVRGVGPKKN